MKWSFAFLEQLANRTLDAAVVVLPEGIAPPDSFVSECLGTVPLTIVAEKAKRVSQPSTLSELASNEWVVNPIGCSSRQLLEAALRQHGLPFSTAVEAEGYDLQLSLISEGVGLGMVLPQVFYSSALRKHLKVVKAKDFSPMLSVWLLHSRHIGRLAPAARCVGEAVKQQLQPRRSRIA